MTEEGSLPAVWASWVGLPICVLADAGRAEAVATWEEEVRAMLRGDHQFIANWTSVAFYLPGK